MDKGTIELDSQDSKLPSVSRDLSDQSFQFDLNKIEKAHPPSRTSMSLMSKQREIMNTVKRTEEEGLHKILQVKYGFDEYGRDDTAWQRNLRFYQKEKEDKLKKDLKI